MTLLEQYMADYQRVCAEKVELQEQVETLRLALGQIEFASRDPNMAAGHAGFLARQALAGSNPAKERP